MASPINIDRRALMNEAWTRTRTFMARNPRGRLRPAFAMYLREAWVNMKSRAAFAMKQAALAARSAASLLAEIEDLENRDTLEAASEAAKRAVATRAERHPHLLPVWDAEAKAPRSVNLATVSRISVNGQVHSFPI